MNKRLTLAIDTSKFQKTNNYGHRGLFLHSLSALSLLTVTSRRVQQRSTNSVIYHHSRPVARLIPAPVHQHLRYSKHGTCVTVNDLFGNMPVRVKSRALALQKPDELDREWDRLRYSLVALLLANPQLLRLVVSDAERGARVSIRLESPHQSLAPVHDVDLGRIGSILSQSGMTSSRSMDSWHIISAKLPDLNISAAISTTPSPTKKFQFISLGQDPVLPRSGHNILFTEINRMISASDFGISGLASRGTTATSESPAPGPSDARSSVSGRSWAKPVNKWPMFYLRIETSSALPLSEDEDEAFPGSEKGLQRIMEVLEAMITEFLKNQNMRPRTGRRGVKLDGGQDVSSAGRNTRSASASSKQTSDRASIEEGFARGLKLPSFHRPHAADASHDLQSWSRAKTAKGLNEQHPHPSQGGSSGLRAHLSPPSGNPDQSNLEVDATNPIPSVFSLQSIHSPENVPQESHNDMQSDGTQTADRMIPWLDQRTGKTHMINSRTGQTVQSTKSAVSREHIMSRPGNAQEDSSDRNAWVENLLRAWDNPTFARTEMPLPRFDLETNYMGAAKCTHEGLNDIAALGAAQVAKFKGKLSRQSLATANIIAQVDQKYILAKLSTNNSEVTGDQETILVLIDQHAADERCRIENLFGEMFGSTQSIYDTKVRTIEIDPINFKISSTESGLFQKHLGFFGHWGIQYAVKDSSSSESIVSVSALPALIAERCRLEPSLVVEILRREIWTNEENDGRPLGPGSSLVKNNAAYDASFSEAMTDSSASHSWVQKMSGCPQSVLDLLNSRACRGAIMFNDPLSNDDCRVLISRLAKCAFPFQCAHGRPSMIPILDLRPQLETGPELFDGRMISGDPTEHEDSGLDFIQAFRGQFVR